VWVLRDLVIWQASSPYSQEKSQDTELQKYHIFICRSLPTSRDREERTHTYPHMAIKSQICLHDPERKKLVNIAPVGSFTFTPPCLKVANLSLERRADLQW
jgi:hypothetical protein